MAHRIKTQWPGQAEERDYGFTARAARSFVVEVARFWREEGHRVRISRRYGTDATVWVYDYDGNMPVLTVTAELWD